MKDDTAHNAHAHARATRALLRRHAAELVCAAALILMSVNSLLVIREKCVTTDEAFMIPAGYYHLTERDLRPVNEHPPLVKILSAAPLLLMDVSAPPTDGVDMTYYVNSENIYWRFWRANRERFDELQFWSRVPMVMLAALLGVALFVYARRYFGARAAGLAVLLYSIEPTVLAHGRVAQTDIPAALGLLLFSVAFYEYVKAPTVRRALWLGFVLGLAVVMKFSMVVLGPFAALALVLPALRREGRTRRGLRSFAAQAALAAVVSVLTINAAYLFRHREPDAGEVNDTLTQAFPESDGARRALAGAFGVVVKILPYDFVDGVAWQVGHAREGHDASLMGRYSSHGWWYYFPVAFALKTTLPFLLLSVASIVWAAIQYARTRERRWLLLVVPFALYTLLLMSNTINIGVRYYLPAYVFLFVAAGAFLDWLLGRARLPRAAALAAVAALFVWMGVEYARAFPDYMAYTNQLARGRPDYWYLSDSNLEWGDDVRALAEYLRARGETRVAVSLLNFNVLEIYGLDTTWAYAGPGAKPAGVRYVALGASVLNGSINPSNVDGRNLTPEERVNLFDDYRHRTPEKVFGKSIYLYRVGD